MTTTTACSTRTILAGWRADPTMMPGQEPMPLDRALQRLLDQALATNGVNGHRLVGKPRLRVLTVDQAFALYPGATFGAVCMMPATITLLALELDQSCQPVEPPC